MADVIEFNDANPSLEKPEGYEDQGGLLRAESTNGRNSSWYEQHRQNLVVGGSNGIDAALKAHNLDALISPANGLSYIPAALVGYPVVTVPLGFYPADLDPKESNDFLVQSPHEQKNVRSRETLYYPAPGMPFGLT